ncbi:hypothetical protein Taro_012448 [Colocasia esculenta]|uniref:glutathione transferase n=1 Tax=Colocasia esculenta TaxID=4460 RepID=A0A843UD10_COLES|nr:hypothetical protein [Colocasia esculenta]
MGSVVKLHGLPMSTNTARVIAVLNEKGVDFELVPVDLSPFGQVPVLEDGDLKLFESRAISKYLAEKHSDAGADLLLRRGGRSLAESATVELWVEVESKHFDPAISPLLYEAVVKPVLGQATDEAVVEAKAAELEKVLDVYEERLGKAKYLAGDHYTLADLHHQPYLFYLMKTAKAELVESRPRVLAWWNDISARAPWLKTAEGMKFP